MLLLSDELLLISTSSNHRKRIKAGLSRRFLKQLATRLELVFLHTVSLVFLLLANNASLTLHRPRATPESESDLH